MPLAGVDFNIPPSRFLLLSVCLPVCLSFVVSLAFSKWRPIQGDAESASAPINQETFRSRTFARWLVRLRHSACCARPPSRAEQTSSARPDLRALCALGGAYLRGASSPGLAQAPPAKRLAGSLRASSRRSKVVVRRRRARARERAEKRRINQQHPKLFAVGTLSRRNHFRHQAATNERHRRELRAAWATLPSRAEPSLDRIRSEPI